MLAVDPLAPPTLARAVGQFVGVDDRDREETARRTTTAARTAPAESTRDGDVAAALDDAAVRSAGEFASSPRRPRP